MAGQRRHIACDLCGIL
jgi:hypothetical protein